MSEIRNINPNKYNKNGHAIILRKITKPEVIKLNRYLLMAVLALMAMIMVLGFLVIPNSNGLLRAGAAEQNTTEIYNLPMNPAVSAEIKMLKAQLVGLISGSIESKIRILENSIRTGIIASTDMGTIQDLKNDVKVLKTYSETGAGRLIAQPELEKKSRAANLANEQLLKEISQLKGLVYISIVSCGLMLAAIGGVWLNGRYRFLGHDNESENMNIARKMLGRKDT